ncbi:hypothetical protein Pla110_37810 [Polystyrenella longa]|uniref:Uncharacterized protein n=2 Tax=Polystyrenella longa TaxID=2528007 RepID=A0A518CS26_9PLAN|nr:hypothetical protein Pla110_37810 [Polystyrenella longa]
MSLLGIALLAGCQSTAKREVWEARFRDQRDEIHALNQKIEQLEEDLVVREQEADTLRLQMVGTGQTALLHEQAHSLYQVTGIRINTLLTGGLDHDGKPGDEAISLLLSPHDEDGTLVKLPGNLLIELIDHSLSEEEEVIGQWEFHPQEMKSHWHSGFVGVGYLFDLTWQDVPENEELLIHARLTTGDNRQFDVTEKIRIVPPEGLLQANHTEVVDEGEDSSPFYSTRTSGSMPPVSRPTNANPWENTEEELVPVPTDQFDAPPVFEVLPEEFDAREEIPPFEEPGYLRLPDFESDSRTKFDDFPR